MFSGVKKYPAQILLLCFAVTVAIVFTSCGGKEQTSSDTEELSENELYLVEAYIDIKYARGFYPHDPTVAESLFVVLDSTIDSVRIANTIENVNQNPDRWALIFEAIEQELREAQAERAFRQERPSKKPRPGS